MEAKQNDGWNGLLVGDMSQPRGGPMLTGHASHQIGLDADVWLTPMPDRTLTRGERENLSATLMVKDRTDNRQQGVDRQPTHGSSQRAASYPEVARIFVHPPIKAELCKWATGDRSWLAKVRPYYGHNYHFHIRMNCPPGFGRLQEPGAGPRPRTAPDAAKNWPTGWATSRGRSQEAGPQRQAGEARPALDTGGPSC